MKNIKLLLPSITFCFLFAITSMAQPSVSLPRSTPEAEGVSSEDILNFLDVVAKYNKHEFHSIMVVRHGKVVTEAWWAPYRSDLRHTLYSCSKSFTATAVGFAVSEGKLSLEDKAISFFPAFLPKEISPNLAALTIKDLLSMTVGMDPDPSFSIAATEENWIKGFFKTPILNQPGTKFLYNSLGTYMAGAIVQKVTGQSLVDYLKPRLFEPLGIEGMDWEKDLLGYDVGGWGLRLKTEDMAKFAQLFLQKGKWNGRQILPEAWVAEATTLKILQKPDISQEARDKDDWAQGYCYQMWRSRHNSYRGDGAYGQLMLVLPELDAVIAITAETNDMQAEMDMVWDYLLPAFRDKPMPEGEATSNLRKRIPTLQLRKSRGGVESPMAKAVDGKCYKLQTNELQLTSIEFDLNDGVCKATLNTKAGKFPLKFGAGKWEEGTTKRLGPYLVAGIKGYYAGLPSKVAGTYAWLDDNTLQLKLRYIESPHSETFTCHFDGKKVKVEYEKSNDFGGKKVVMEGGR